jgi:hypothetical protein
MGMQQMTDLEDQLETLLDGNVLSNVIEALSNVCKTRADGDETQLARHWNDAAVRLERLATAIERLGL